MFAYNDLIGIPFVDGGRDVDGLDCWGLVRLCFLRQGIKLKDYAISAWDLCAISRKMEEESHAWQKIDTPEPGCLVAIRTSSKTWVNHAGVCINAEEFIHAYAVTGVSLARIRRWRALIVGFYRYIGGGQT